MLGDLAQLVLATTRELQEAICSLEKCFLVQVAKHLGMITPQPTFKLTNPLLKFWSKVKLIGFLHRVIAYVICILNAKANNYNFHHF